MLRLHKLGRRFADIDRNLLRRSAAISASPADGALKALSTAADQSLLWFVVAAVLACRKGVPRRAALRSVGAIAGSSLITQLLAKPLQSRRRPATGSVPAARRLQVPHSSSFPSGHAASAAAVVTAVAVESPRLSFAFVPLALAVIYSRVHTGVHWPTDALGGIAVGTGIGLATWRCWPSGAPSPEPSSRHASTAPL